MTSTEFKCGNRYNWRGQPERLIYMGCMVDRSGEWHQFAKVEEPSKVWCEVRAADLASFEETVEGGAG